VFRWDLGSEVGPSGNVRIGKTVCTTRTEWQVYFVKWHRFWQQLFIYSKGRLSQVEKYSLRAHMYLKCQYDSFFHSASLPRYMISNGTHLEIKIIDVNVLSRHTSHSSLRILHIQSLAIASCSFKHHFPVWTLCVGRTTRGKAYSRWLNNRWTIMYFKEHEENR
jgi:hypothetical protein